MPKSKDGGAMRATDVIFDGEKLHMPLQFEEKGDDAIVHGHMDIEEISGLLKIVTAILQNTELNGCFLTPEHFGMYYSCPEQPTSVLGLTCSLLKGTEEGKVFFELRVDRIDLNRRNDDGTLFSAPIFVLRSEMGVADRDYGEIPTMYSEAEKKAKNKDKKGQ